MPPLLAFDPQSLGVLTAYSAAVVAASIVGGMLPEWIRLTHTRMQLTISFVGGLMLGISIFHMIPHALAGLGPQRIDQLTWGLMLGLLATFFLLRFFHFHQHGPADFGVLAGEQEEWEADTLHSCGDHHGHTHAHPHPTGPADVQDAAHAPILAQHHGTLRSAGSKPVGLQPVGNARWLAVLVGLGLHTLMDGVALGSGVAIESGHGAMLPGLGIFLAVLLHKPLDAVSITSLMHPVTSANKRVWVNVGFAMMCPVGALLFMFGASVSEGWSATIAGWGLAFSAGVFLCIALSDLLPEMEFHSHSRVPLSISLLLGILAAWAIGLFEGNHAHHHSTLPKSFIAEPYDPLQEHQHAHATMLKR